jgi:hypothetical protein
VSQPGAGGLNKCPGAHRAKAKQNAHCGFSKAARAGQKRQGPENKRKKKGKTNKNTNKRGIFFEFLSRYGLDTAKERQGPRKKLLFGYESFRLRTSF